MRQLSAGVHYSYQNKCVVVKGKDDSMVLTYAVAARYKVELVIESHCEHVFNLVAVYLNIVNTRSLFPGNERIEEESSALVFVGVVAIYFLNLLLELASRQILFEVVR